MSSLKFHKKERLSSRAEIDSLFKSGKSFMEFPFKVIHQSVSHTENNISEIGVLITIPKRIYKKAVDRNLLRRRTKEAYRLHKSSLYKALEKKEIKLKLALIYIGPKPMNYNEISSKIILILNRLITLYE
jgi:ribonuclease P protein component